MAPEIKGLFLGGGFSHRMGADKALLQYGPEPELRRWQGLFASLGLPFYWSQRLDQHTPDQFSDIPRLYDETPGAGPLAAVRTAHRAYPEAAWLVLACDWPLLGRDDLERLIHARDPACHATAYAIGGQLEPLCAIYEPQCWIGLDPEESSLSRVLRTARVKGIAPIDPGRFLNANDVLSRQKASQSLAHRSDR